MKRLAKKLTKSAIERVTTIDAVNQLLTRLFMDRYNLPVKPLHYYSPLPNVSELKAKYARWYQPGDWSTIDVDREGQIRLLKELEPFKFECDQLPSFDEISAKGYGPGYGEVEAHLLHCILRHLKPRKVIEVGSGVSSFFIANALNLNREEKGTDGRLTCIEPFPNDRLRQLIGEHSGTLEENEVQAVDLALFKALEAGDVLFIDSSHVSKIGSDVNYLYLDVMPVLQRGVWIHIHDMPFPYLAAPPEHPLFDLYLLWNEAALVKSFLMYNSAFKIRVSQSYLHHESPQALAEMFSVYDHDKHFPLSLWLEKTGS